jgi:hypothetical protein
MGAAVVSKMLTGGFFFVDNSISLPPAYPFLDTHCFS